MSRSPTERKLRFDTADIELFADVSGDRNPLHLDPVFARRSPFGSCIVQGSLAALAALGSLPPDALGRIRRLRATYSAPILPGTMVAVAAHALPGESGAWHVTVSGRGRELVRLSVSENGTEARPGEFAPERGRPMLQTPNEVVPQGEISGEYDVGPRVAELVERCDTEKLDARLLAGLLWASYVVGMEAPGLHSLFAGVRLDAVGEAVGIAAIRSQRLDVASEDERTGRLVVRGTLFGVDGPAASAEIEAFGLVPIETSTLTAAPPARAPEPAAVVIIGGSRGFGAALALALLATGATVHVVYSASSDAAEELRSAAGDHADRLALHRCDARDTTALQSVAETLSEGPRLDGLVLSAAQPPLGMGVTPDSAVEISTYVAESVLLAAAPLSVFLPILDHDSAWMLLCSSSAVTTPPREWPHYVAAKGALESVAAWTARTHPSMRTVVLRAPKLRTDLTNTPTGRLGAADPATLARWVVERLALPVVGEGLTMLEPTTEELEQALPAGGADR